MESKSKVGKSRWRSSLYFVGALISIGCAAAQVTTNMANAPLTNAPPTEVVVYDFAVNASEVTLNSGFIQRAYRDLSNSSTGQDRFQIAQQTAHTLATDLVQQLQAKGLYAVNLPRGAQPPPGNVLIIDGQFVDINEGNQLRRTVIGLGVGESNLNTNVQVFQSTRGTSEAILEFTTHADSGEMPGAAIMGAPGMAVGGTAAIASAAANVAAGGVKAYRSTPDFLADMTAKKIVMSLANYYATQGWPAIAQ